MNEFRGLSVRSAGFRGPTSPRPTIGHPTLALAVQQIGCTRRRTPGPTSMLLRRQRVPTGNALAFGWKGAESANGLTAWVPCDSSLKGYPVLVVLRFPTMAQRASTRSEG